ncbi:MAG: hypothetical protein R6V13_05565 [Anaerolineae bacterium]
MRKEEEMGEEKDKSFRITQVDLHPHLQARMHQPCCSIPFLPPPPGVVE